MKRYELEMDDSGYCYACMVEDDNGSYIEYDDYIAEKAVVVKPTLSEVPKCEAERYQFGKVLLQRLNKDCMWYAIFDGQIVDVDRYRSDLEERVRHFAQRESVNDV